jgi:AraC-like DNA-binding protein
VLAKECGVSEVHLARAFRHFHGITVGEYIRNLRIAEAKRDLASSAESITDIAQRLGFFDQSHFTRAFKAATGLAPIRFRAATKM